MTIAFASIIFVAIIKLSVLFEAGVVAGPQDVLQNCVIDLIYLLMNG